MSIAIKQMVSVAFLGRIFVQFQIAIFGLAIASLLSKSNFGLFQQLTAFSVLAVTIVRFGLEIIAQFEIPKKLYKVNLDSLNNNMIKIKILGSIISVPIVIFMTIFLSENLDTLTILFLAAATFFIAVNRYIIDAIMVYSLKITSAVILNNMLAFSKLLSVIYLSSINMPNVQTIFGVLALIEFIYFFYLCMKYKIFRKNFFNINFSLFTKENLKHAYHQYGDVLFCSMLSMAGGVLVLSLFKDLELLASYTFVLAVVLGIFSGGSLNSILEPILNTLLLRKLKLHSNDFSKAEIEKILGVWCFVSLISNLFIGLSLFIFMTFVNEQFLDLKYSNEILKILFAYIGLALFCWTYQYSTWALLNKRVDVLRNSSLISGLLHYAIIGLLTLLFGIDGAISALIISQFFKCCIIHFALKKPNFIVYAFASLKEYIFEILILVLMIGTSIYFDGSVYQYLAFSLSFFTAFIIILYMYKKLSQSIINNLEF